MLTIIFIILFVIIHASLKEGAMFGDNMNILMAICVAILCILGMQQFFGVRILTTEQFNVPAEITSESAEKIPEEDRKKEVYLFPLLFPYTALALTLLLLPFILMIAAIIQRCRIKKIYRRTFDQIMKSRIEEKRNKQTLLRK